VTGSKAPPCFGLVQLIAINNVIDFVPVVIFALPPRSLTAHLHIVQVCASSSGPVLASAPDWSSSQSRQGMRRRRA